MENNRNISHGQQDAPRSSISAINVRKKDISQIYPLMLQRRKEWMEELNIVEMPLSLYIYTYMRI